MGNKQYEVLKWASLFLEKHNREPRVAEILLQHYLNVTRSTFYMKMQDPVAAPIIEKFKEDIMKHAETGIPVQHLTGVESFYGREFLVNQNVLIPRPETEELVQYVINDAAQDYDGQALTIVDVGTGSGAIAISLALELPNATVYATDISTDALHVAKENAARLQAKIHFLEGNFLEPFIDGGIQADIIVSNPPYIAKTEMLADTVKDFDPALALFADEDGLAAYKQIINQAQKVAKQNTALAFEIGYTQADAVSSIIEHTFPTSEVQTIQDINGKDRIIAARL
ncbi:peptide chain release factor N(5)-glutamine methyltransferase [Oceanobacillus chungangensis]|uniref:Release factor glutamine methyltransferase n=1 Tax=Oceanobacillus chungangensis TaxID=1229152 RepID=A0A3D8PXN7_9BACI|nr:peptide chain release factor N(5)-glutamine methyltransferase [Oceanobacillus chungangensis]RDW20532.1 peptide chain release factor N(5)-glutamine methyltransferase [Oceanobacillus chungangensis]